MRLVLITQMTIMNVAQAVIIFRLGFMKLLIPLCRHLSQIIQTTWALLAVAQGLKVGITLELGVMNGTVHLPLFSNSMDIHTAVLPHQTLKFK